MLDPKAYFSEYLQWGCVQRSNNQGTFEKKSEKEGISRKINSTHREMELENGIKYLGNHEWFSIEYKVYDEWVTEMKIKK